MDVDAACAAKLTEMDPIERKIVEAALGGAHDIVLEISTEDVARLRSHGYIVILRRDGVKWQVSWH